MALRLGGEVEAARARRAGPDAGPD
jgi:hypothetical protein